MAKIPEILVVDQDPQARFEVRRLVKQTGLGFAGEAAFGTEAVSLASDAKPDVIFCGVSQPADRSLHTIEALLDVLPETPIIAFARQEDVELVRQAMQAGARDFLAIPADAQRLSDAVKNALESEERKRLRLSGQSKGLGPRGLSIAVFGAKGGIGKTTIATNLGAALAQMGQSVVVVDGDNSFGDVAAVLELKPERTIIDLIGEVESVDRANVTDFLTQHSSGVWVLSAPKETLHWRSVTPEAFRKVVEVVSRRFDIVLIDTAAVLSDLSMAVLDEAKMVLWVTSTDFSSINNSLLGLHTLNQLNYPDAKVRLVLNVNTSDDGVRPGKIEEVLGRRFFWSIPYDRSVRQGGQIGKPAVLSAPSSVGSKSLTELAEVLTGAKAIEQPKRSALDRLFRRDSTATVEPTKGAGRDVVA